MSKLVETLSPQDAFRCLIFLFGSRQNFILYYNRTKTSLDRELTVYTLSQWTNNKRYYDSLPFISFVRWYLVQKHLHAYIPPKVFSKYLRILPKKEEIRFSDFCIANFFSKVKYYAK